MTKFTKNENDWIIFEYDSNLLYVPQKFIFQNQNNSQGVKIMDISIGNIKTNKWFTFNPNPINIKMMNGPQTKEIDGVNWKIITKNKLRYIKLQFIKNHGSSHGCYFDCYGFQLYGYRC